MPCPQTKSYNSLSPTHLAVLLPGQLHRCLGIAGDNVTPADAPLGRSCFSFAIVNVPRVQGVAERQGAVLGELGEEGEMRFRIEVWVGTPILET